MIYLFKQNIQGKANYWGYIDNQFVNRVDKSESFLFTGMADKFNKKIFDKDFVSDGTTVYQVEYNDLWGSFYINPVRFVDEAKKNLPSSMGYKKLGNGFAKLDHLELI